MRDLLNKRIPTLLGIFFLVLGIGATSYLAENGTFFKSQAEENTTPENIRITNITESTLTVSYTTKEKATGTLSFGSTSSLDATILDDRDQKSKTPNFYTTHHITVKTLQANSKYYFVINSGKITVKNNNAPFEVMTGQKLEKKTGKEQVLKGKIVSPDGLPLPEILGFATVDNGQMLSTIVSNNGSYEFSLTNLRNQSFTSFLSYSPQTLVKLLFISATGQSTVKIPILKTHAVPIIIFSEQFDFSPQFNDSTNETSSSFFEHSNSFPLFSSDQLKKNGELGLFTSDFEKGIIDSKPFFRGTTGPNADVMIVIQSTKRVRSKVKANLDGRWTYQPEQNLLPGKYTITISSIDTKTRLSHSVSALFIITTSPNVSVSPTL